jgi:CRISPR/Cas system-associated exonuclease Cas4 (RecB family)
MATTNNTQEIIDTQILSQSSINRFFECQRRFKLEYIDKKRGRKEAGMDQGFRYDWLGRVIHQVLEEFYKVEYFPSEKDLDADGANKIELVLLSLLDKYWEFGQPELHLIDAKNMLKMFAQREAQRWAEYRADPESDILFVPQYREFELLDESIRLRAIVDVMWIDKKGHINPHPRDYKTNKKPEITQAMKLQACVTAILINNKLEEMPSHFEFLFLRTNKSLLYEITTENINKAITIIEKMWKEIESENFPKNLANCFWCPVKNYCEGESRCWI